MATSMAQMIKPPVGQVQTPSVTAATAPAPSVQADTALRQAPAAPGSAPSDRAAFAMQFYQQHPTNPLAPHQAAGLVGNFQQESGRALNPTAVGDNGTSFGIGQWRGDRFKALQDFARQRQKPWQDFETQLDFALHEGETTEREAFTRLRSATNVEEATAAGIGFERPRGFTWENPRGGHGWGNRLSFANSLAGSGSPATGGEQVASLAKMAEQWGFPVQRPASEPAPAPGTTRRRGPQVSFGRTQHQPADAPDLPGPQVVRGGIPLPQVPVPQIGMGRREKRRSAQIGV